MIIINKTLTIDFTISNLIDLSTSDSLLADRLIWPRNIVSY